LDSLIAQSLASTAQPSIQDEPIEDQPIEDAPIEDELIEYEPIEDEPIEDEPIEDEPFPIAVVPTHVIPTPVEPTQVEAPSAQKLKIAVDELLKGDPTVFGIVVHALDMVMEEIFRRKHGAFFDKDNLATYKALITESLDEMVGLHDKAQLLLPEKKRKIPRGGKASVRQFHLLLIIYPSISA
jgi:hypothetical protein